MCAHSTNSESCDCRWRCTCLQWTHCNVSAASTLDTRSVIADTRPVASPVGDPTSPVDVLPPGNSLSAVVAGETTRRGCIKWREAKVALAKQAPERARKSALTGHPAAPKAQRNGPSAEQMDLGDGME